MQVWTAGFTFGMLCDRDVAQQAHRDVLAAVPNVKPGGRTDGNSIVCSGHHAGISRSRRGRAAIGAGMTDGGD